MSTKILTASTATSGRRIDTLRTQIEGAVLTATDERYDELRQAWNLDHVHHPAVVVVPAHADDVASTVRWAADAGLPVCIQATGHGVIRTADGGVLVVTSELTDVHVDAEAWTARIGAGAKWERVLGPAIAAGLAPLLGSTPDVSAVGYTLGGGMGWLARKYGLSADHVRSIEIVTADGCIRTASPDSDADLFWALRGGGAGSLGVVTEIEVDLVPVTRMYAGNLLYPASMARQVGARYREWVRDVPDDLTSSISFMNFPPFDDVPEPVRGRSFAIVRGAFLGSDEDGAALLDHWRSWRAPELDLWGPMPFADVATISNDPLDPMRSMSSSEWLDEITDELVDILVRVLFEGEQPNPLVFAEIRHAGASIARQPEHPNAYSPRGFHHLLHVVGSADDDGWPALQERYRSLQHELTPHVPGIAYLNFLEGDEKRRRTRAAFDDETFARLQQIKSDVDPTNLFGHGLPLV